MFIIAISASSIIKAIQSLETLCITCSVACMQDSELSTLLNDVNIFARRHHIPPTLHVVFTHLGLQTDLGKITFSIEATVNYTIVISIKGVDFICIPSAASPVCTNFLNW